MIATGWVKDAHRSGLKKHAVGHYINAGSETIRLFINRDDPPREILGDRDTRSNTNRGTQTGDAFTPEDHYR